MIKEAPEQYVEWQKLDDLKALVDFCAEKHKGNPCFSYRKGKELVYISFLQFYNDVRALGNYLLRHGYQNGARIAVIGENSYPWIVAYFAATCSGNVIVPIDKELKPSEVAQLLNNSESSILFYAASKESYIPEMQSCGVTTDKFICFEKEFSDILAEGEKTAADGFSGYDDVHINPDEMCAIIYTSGTTGDPKGVMISHRNLTADAYRSMSCMIIPKKTTMAVLPLNHTFGMMACVICQLWMGFYVHINNSLKMVLKDIQTVRPQHIALVPLFLEKFYSSIWKNAEKQGKSTALKCMVKLSNILLKVGIDKRRSIFKEIHKNFGGRLEIIITGGAPISEKLMKGFHDFGFTVVNGYGITECSPIVTLTRNNCIIYGTAGRVIPGMEIKIDQPDENGEGEICVKGDIVMLGYYKNPEETAKVLKDGWFYTGDIGKLDGTILRLTGRKKNMIVLDNGKNVYPEEIETLISYIPNVTEVVVYQKNNLLVAEVYSDAEGDKDAIQTQIKNDIENLNKTFAAYKQIKQVKFRDIEFEKTTTKKIRRNKLKI